MKITKHLTVLSFLLLPLGMAVRADTFNFSYAFGDGLLVTGSLEGTQNGEFIEGITDVSVLFAGTPMPGDVYFSSYAGAGVYVDGPIVSFDVFKNNFTFSNSNLVAGDFGFDSIFYILNASIDLDTAVAFSSLGYASQDQPTVAASWSLTPAGPAAVPDAGGVTTMLGIALLGFACAARKFGQRPTGPRRTA